MIGENAVVGAMPADGEKGVATVGSGVEIGAGAKIGPNAMINNNVKAVKNNGKFQCKCPGHPFSKQL